MIDNIVLVITGTHHDRDTAELLEKCHPLGMFDSMATLCVATSPAELYRMVLVDTPLGPYFGDCLSLEDLDDFDSGFIWHEPTKNWASVSEDGDIGVSACRHATHLLRQVGNRAFEPGHVARVVLTLA